MQCLMFSHWVTMTNTVCWRHNAMSERLTKLCVHSHLRKRWRALLAEKKKGGGEIIFLTDPCAHAHLGNWTYVACWGNSGQSYPLEWSMLACTVGIQWLVLLARKSQVWSFDWSVHARSFEKQWITLLAVVKNGEVWSIWLVRASTLNTRYHRRLLPDTQS